MKEKQKSRADKEPEGPQKEKVCACFTEGKSLCGDPYSMNTIVRANVTCEKCLDILKHTQEMEARIKSLKDFYYRMMKSLNTDLDKILFIQCFDALNQKEGRDLSRLYQEDFNRALLEFKRTGKK